MNSKDEIAQAMARVIEYRITREHIRVEDNEKLLALKRRIIEDVKATNHPIRAWIKSLIKNC